MWFPLTRSNSSSSNQPLRHGTPRPLLLFPRMLPRICLRPSTRQTRSRQWCLLQLQCHRQLCKFLWGRLLVCRRLLQRTFLWCHLLLLCRRQLHRRFLWCHLQLCRRLIEYSTSPIRANPGDNCCSSNSSSKSPTVMVLIEYSTSPIWANPGDICRSSQSQESVRLLCPAGFAAQGTPGLTLQLPERSQRLVLIAGMVSTGHSRRL